MPNLKGINSIDFEEVEVEEWKRLDGFVCLGFGRSTPNKAKRVESVTFNRLS